MYPIVHGVANQVTKAVAYLAHLARTRKLFSFAHEHKLSYVYLWQLKTPKTDSRGRPLRDKETGRVLYRRTPSFRIINKLKEVIPSEYWYEEASQSPEGASAVPTRGKKRPRAENATLEALWMLPDDPFCGVVSAYECDPELAVRSSRFSYPLPKIILDFSIEGLLQYKAIALYWR